MVWNENYPQGKKEKKNINLHLKKLVLQNQSLMRFRDVL